MADLSSSGWTLKKDTGSKRIWYKFEGSELLICEEWLEDANLLAAQQLREIHDGTGTGTLKPLAVIPASVENRAITEGWMDDPSAWRKWANDVDHNKLRIKGGRA